MIYVHGLEQIVLDRHLSNKATELIILGGFIAPSPVSKITQKNINTKIIYGCKSQANLNHTYHEKYQDYSKNGHAEIFYKRAYNHSKIYCWLKHGVVQEILLGSANFSHSGMKNDHEEILTSVDKSDFDSVYQYLKDALDDSESCLSYNYAEKHKPITSPKRKAARNAAAHSILSRQPPKARIPFRDSKGKLSQINSGPRYSQSKSKSHVNLNDCTIGLRKALVEDIPELFPNNGINPMIGTGYKRKKEKSSAHKIEFLWDDGEVMEMSFEAKGHETPGRGCLYKALRSSGIEKNSNAKLGKYLRKRVGLASGTEFTDDNLKNYGRDHFDLTLMDPGIYFADFGVKELSKDQ